MTFFYSFNISNQVEMLWDEEDTWHNWPRTDYRHNKTSIGFKPNGRADSTYLQSLSNGHREIISIKYIINLYLEYVLRAS